MGNLWWDICLYKDENIDRFSNPHKFPYQHWKDYEGTYY